MNIIDTAAAHDRLAAWIIDYDFSPKYTTGIFELIDILQILIPSDDWDKVRETINHS